MNEQNFVAAYDSQDDKYQAAFDVFLATTDQKDNARARLDPLVGELPRNKGFRQADGCRNHPPACLPKTFVPWELAYQTPATTKAFAKRRGDLPGTVLNGGRRCIS